MVRKADHEKPPVARWATLRRRERHWEASDVLRRLAAAGEPISESYLRAIEGGSKRPSGHVLAALEALYGDTPDMKEEPPPWAEALRYQIVADVLTGLLDAFLPPEQQADAAARLQAFLEQRRRQVDGASERRSPARDT